MKIDEFRKIVNEEISGFNFLGMDEMLKEEEEIATLQDEEFQRQFIIDSITNFKEKINIIETDTAYVQEPDWTKGEDSYGSDKIVYGLKSHRDDVLV